MDFQGILDILLKYWPMFLRGAGVTLLISIVGTILGTCIGLLVGIIRTIPVPEKRFKKAILKIVNVILSIYIEVFRGTPMIVQAMVIYFGSLAAFNIDMNKMTAAFLIVMLCLIIGGAL